MSMPMEKVLALSTVTVTRRRLSSTMPPTPVEEHRHRRSNSRASRTVTTPGLARVMPAIAAAASSDVAAAP